MIKADGSGKVKGRLALSLLRRAAKDRVFRLLVTAAFAAALSAGMALAQGQNSIDTVDTGPITPDKTTTADDQINPIDAEEFHVRILKQSRSKRVLLFEDTAENKPKSGKILLIKQDKDEIVAVRVLKNYPRKFAAKIVLPFGTQPKVGGDYRALKKIGDKIIEMIKAREKAISDLDSTKTDEQLAGEVPPDDEELDRGIPMPGAEPAPKKETSVKPNTTEQEKPQPLWDKDGNELTPESIEVADEEEPFADLSVREDLPLEPHNHVVSFQYAQITTGAKDNGSKAYDAYGVRYGYNFGRMTFLKKRTLQDMFTAELGLFIIPIASYYQQNDAVTALPAIATLRYNFLIGETLAFFIYGGVEYNFVQQDGTIPTAQIKYLATTAPAVGGGVLLSIGPAWGVRAEFGYNFFGIGGTLKF